MVLAGSDQRMPYLMIGNDLPFLGIDRGVLFLVSGNYNLYAFL